jgi:hypothetical protein
MFAFSKTKEKENKKDKDKKLTSERLRDCNVTKKINLSFSKLQFFINIFLNFLKR